MKALPLIGTALVHVALAAALILSRPMVPLIPPAPVHEIEVEPPPPPPAPVPVPAEPQPLPEPRPETPQPQPTTHAPTAHVSASHASATPTTDHTTSDSSAPAVPGNGGDNAPVVKIENLGGAGTVAVGTHPGTGGGSGGSGSQAGTGAGTGTGTAAVSIASIKTRAKPKGDTAYIDLGKDYPPEAKQLGIQGDLKVRLLVDASGKVTKATLLNHLGHGLDELALARAKLIQFEPALDTDDHAVASIVVWTFSFTLPG